MQFASLLQGMMVLGAIGRAAAYPNTDRWWEYHFECYPNGEQWHNYNEIIDHINNACYGYNGIRGYYQDVYEFLEVTMRNCLHSLLGLLLPLERLPVHE
jgi:hypothetical protein